MSDVNMCLFTGRLARDPEIKVTATGNKVCTFSVASNETWGVGEARKERTAFFECEAWDKTAEGICRFLKKGSFAHFTARYAPHNYTTKEGDNRTFHRFTVRDFNLIGPAPKKEPVENTGTTSNISSTSEDSGSDEAVDDIPF